MGSIINSLLYLACLPYYLVFFFHDFQRDSLEPMQNPRNIPIMRPLLPEAQYILPYLETIDKNRWYSNFGPLAVEFERRLEKFFDMGQGTVLTVANGTSGLSATLRALDLPKGSFCLVPSWTFMASPAAAIASGLVPYFIDIDKDSWAIEPESVKEWIKKVPGMVSAVMVVSPFGAPLDTAKWDEFSSETGIKVLIDAAAGFDSFSTVPKAKPGKCPVMISMHATKVFGLGEGGIIISSDAGLMQRVRELINFGFSGAREIRLPGTNAKMSEYAAAVGLAALDLWSHKKAVWTRLKLHYIESFRECFGRDVSSPWLLSDEWVSSVCNVSFTGLMAKDIIAALKGKGIEGKQWWTRGCHNHPAYAKFLRMELPVTEMLADTVVGLPFSIDLSRTDIDYVIEHLRNITRT